MRVLFLGISFLIAFLCADTAIHFFCYASFFVWFLFHDDLINPNQKIPVLWVKEDNLTLHHYLDGTIFNYPCCFDWELLLLPSFQLTPSNPQSNYPFFLILWAYKHNFPLQLLSGDCRNKSFLSLYSDSRCSILSFPIYSLAFSVARTRSVILFLSSTIFRLTFLTLVLSSLSNLTTPSLVYLFSLANFDQQTTLYSITLVNLTFLSFLTEVIFQVISWIFQVTQSFLFFFRSPQEIVQQKEQKAKDLLADLVKQERKSGY